MFSNLTPARQKVNSTIDYKKQHIRFFQLLIKISIFLNLCLLLYLSLSAGSKISLGSQPSHPHPAPLAEASSSFRENINKHEGHSDQGTKPDQLIEKSCETGEESRPVTKFSLSENVSCLNKAIKFSQVRMKKLLKLLKVSPLCYIGYQEQVLGPL